MQWVTIITYCLEDEAASGKAEAAVANREPVSQRRGRRGAVRNVSATSVTQMLYAAAGGRSSATDASEGRRRLSAHEEDLLRLAVEDRGVAEGPVMLTMSRIAEGSKV